MKIKQIVLSCWNHFLRATGLGVIIEILVLTHNEVKQDEARR